MANFLNKRFDADPILLKELNLSDKICGPTSELSVKIMSALAANRLEWAKDDRNAWLKAATKCERVRTCSSATFVGHAE